MLAPVSVPAEPKSASYNRVYAKIRIAFGWFGEALSTNYGHVTSGEP